MSDLVQFLNALKAVPKPATNGRTMSLAEIITGKTVDQLPKVKIVDLRLGHWVAVGHERPEDQSAVAVAVLRRMLQ